MPSLVLIRGLPGSGKSTLAKNNFSSRLHFEADDYFLDELGNYNFDKNKLYKAHKECLKKTTYALTNGIDVVVSNTFTTIKELNPYYNLRLFIHNLHIEIWECGANFGSIHNVPEKTLTKMQNRWEEIPDDWDVLQLEIN